LPRTCSEIGEALFCIYLFSTRIFADAICFVFCEVVDAMCVLQHSNGLAQVESHQTSDHPPPSAPAACLPLLLFFSVGVSCILALIHQQDALNMAIL
jgi:hypothetical protein